MPSLRERKSQIRTRQKAGSLVHQAAQKKYGFDRVDDSRDVEMRRAFIQAVHKYCSIECVSFLEDGYGNQDQIASLLAKSRSAISKWKTHQSVPADILTAAFANLGFMVPKLGAMDYGLRETIVWVRRNIMKDVSCPDCISAEEYYALLNGVENEWYESFILTICELEDVVVAEDAE